MKNWFLLALLTTLAFSCTLNNDQLTEEDLVEATQENNNNNGDPETVVVNTVCDYAPFTLNSTFTYKGSSGIYTLTVQGNEMIDGVDYARIENDLSGEKTYYTCEGNEYIELMINPDNGDFYPFLYLKTDLNIGDSWDVSTPIGDYTMTVEWIFPEYEFDGYTFMDVFVIQREGPPAQNDVEAQFQSTTWWYAKDVGMIQNTWYDVGIQSFDIQ